MGHCATAELTIRVMTAADLPFAMALKREANWNQTEADFHRLLDIHPAGCRVAEFDGVPVGMLATTIFGDVAWISLVLVDARLRGRGIGTALIMHALAFLDAQGLRTIRLDATPMGQRIYERLGFVTEYELYRYEGIMPEPSLACGVSAYTDDDAEAVMHFDRTVTGTDRTVLLRHLLRACGEQGRVFRHEDGILAGYLLARPGARAWQIGPCIADEEVGPRLLDDACHRYAGQPVFIDIPKVNAPARALVESMGLLVQRPFLRMVRGVAIPDDPLRIWASFGPEKG